METLLIDDWLRGVDAPVAVFDDASLTVVRNLVRQVGVAAGVPAEVIERACLVATEIGKNQLRHARAGRIAVRSLTRDVHAGVEIIGVDRGAGIVDVASALDAAPRAEGTLGIGVGAIRRLSSEVDFDVRIDEGTRIIARVFSRDAPRELEVGVYGRPYPGEKVSGDHASFSRASSDRLVVSVCDGLGHGPAAREAAGRAMLVFDERSSESPAAIVQACQPALEGTRGVVMAVAAIHRQATVDYCSVGNIESRLCEPRSARHFGGSSAIVGGRGNALPKLRSESTPFAHGAVLLMTTDGISSKVVVEQDLTLLREHPIVIAQRVIERWGRTTDDALVLVVR